MTPSQRLCAAFAGAGLTNLRAGCLGAALAVSWLPTLAVADDAWNPFGPPVEDVRPRSRPKATTERTPVYAPPGQPGIDAPAPPAGGAQAPAEGVDETSFSRPIAAQPGYTAATGIDARAGGVERGELAPVMATDGSGLPFELWRGLDVTAVEGLLSKLEVPPRSPTLHALWRRLLTADATSTASGAARFDIVRSEALYRSGLNADATALATKAAASPDGLDPALAVIAAKVGFAGDTPGPTCEKLKPFVARKGDLPKALQRDLLVLSGTCAALNGNPGGAGLAAELLRDEIARDRKLDDPASLAALDAAASGTRTTPRGNPVTLVQYRLHAIAGEVDPLAILARGEPALLTAIALDRGGGVSADAALQARLVAAEGAARLNALSPGELADVWRAAGASVPADQLQSPGQRRPPDGRSADAAVNRAALFKASETERTPARKVRLMRSLLDDAKRAGLYWQTLAALGPVLEPLQPVPELGWFAETGVEIALVSGKPGLARQWANLGGAVPGDGGLRRWLPLIDLVDPALKSERGRSLSSLEDMALRGRLGPDLLHRLATVLDAHDINVPIPLWEATSKVPQPTSGHLPETGVLADLQDAAKKKEFGRTVLLAIRTLGPNGAEGANILALGDGIRALRRAGLEADARRLGLEALFAQWPRGAIN